MNHYQIGSRNPAGHYFDVVLTISEPDKEGQLVRLPAWIPGSYMIRDFAKNIVEISADCNGQPIALTQLDKSTWQLEACSGELNLRYRVYAWDLSVRTAHLDTTHGFFNGSSVFLEVVGQGDRPCTLDVLCPSVTTNEQWKLATTLSRTQGADFGFGSFQAENYQELIDHPVEMGSFTQFDFSACGIRHDVVLTGRFNCDVERLSRDLSKICEQHIGMFGEPAPMLRYLFLVMVVGDSYGGLEHRSSTSLLCSRKNLPQPGQVEMTEEYRDFLGLCSHEYFHSWNVKRIKPAVFDRPDLSSEVYTPLLWAFEGITSYYDDLALLRCGCIARQDYLELIGQTITRVQRGLGRTRQSAAESSFNAWSKFYKQDENSANAIVSYYAKGSLIALCIDLKIRQLTQHQKSLDDVMRQLWVNYQQQGQGVGDDEIQGIICQLVDSDISDLLDQWINSTLELPLAELLQDVSISLDYRASGGQQDKGGKECGSLPACSLGALLKANGALEITSVVEDGAAQLAGLSAGDSIIAINDLRADMDSYQRWLMLCDVGSRHRLTAFRRDELMQFEVVLQAAQKDTAILRVVGNDDPSLAHWLQD